MTIEVVLEPSTSDLEPADPRWVEQVNELARALHKEVDVKRPPPIEVPGKKGIEVANALLIAAGNAGVFTAVVAIFNGWLKQGRKRSLKVSVKDGDHVKVLEVSAEGMSADDVRDVVERMT